MNVPLSALLTVNDVPEAFRTKHKGTTVHALLALFLATGDDVDRTYAPWASTWPTLCDIRESMPLCWPQQGMAASPEGLLDEMDPKNKVVLPPAIERFNTQMTKSKYEPSSTCGLLQVQRRKFRTDWEAVSRLDPDTSYEMYLYYWLIVNTRSFYYEMSNIRTQPSREDCMALCPFIDLFNHNDSGVCSLLLWIKTYTDVLVCGRSRAQRLHCNQRQGLRCVEPSHLVAHNVDGSHGQTSVMKFM